MADASLFSSIINAAPVAGTLAMYDMPPDSWWLSYVVVIILAIAAGIDAVKGIVPDWLILLGLLTATIVQGVYVDWPESGDHLRLGVAAGIGLWLINLLWEKKFRRDAFGMGDAKWTMLAVDCFGLMPSLFAWGCGAVLGVLWLGGARFAGRKVTHVHFAPFLFIGLLAGIYWLRLR